VWHVTNLLLNFDLYLGRVEDALHLFARCHRDIQNVTPGENPIRLSGWQMIASRDTGLSLYHLLHTVRAIGDGARKCPELFARLDREALHRMRKTFHRHFPDTEALRHAISHSAEMAATPAKVRANAPHYATYDHRDRSVPLGLGIPFTLGEVIGTEHHFMVRHNRRAVGVQMTADTLHGLHEVREAIRAAFTPAVEWARANAPPSEGQSDRQS
jgi:hypothetical protein